MKKRQKIALGIIAGLGIAVIGGLSILQARIKPPSEAAQSALKVAKKQADWYYFPSQDSTKPLIIFYPGATVDVASYSIWAKNLAQAGYPVYLVNMPFQLAFFAPDRAEQILKMHPNRSYVMAGHSLGGAMASRFASERLTQHDSHLKGLIYLASFTDQSQALRQSELPALAVTGSQDHDIKEQDVWKKKSAYPKKTEFVSLEGGNHLGFGSVKDAAPGTISNAQQQIKVTEIILKWLNNQDL